MALASSSPPSSTGTWLSDSSVIPDMEIRPDGTAVTLKETCLGPAGSVLFEPTGSYVTYNACFAGESDSGPPNGQVRVFVQLSPDGNTLTLASQGETDTSWSYRRAPAPLAPNPPAPNPPAPNPPAPNPPAANPPAPNPPAPTPPTIPGPVALQATDPAVGLWQRDKTILDVAASGEVRYVSDPVGCRVGAVQGKDFTKVADGQYTVSNGNFAGDACTAGSFSPGFGLQVVGDTLRAGGGKPWTRVGATALPSTDTILGQWTSPDGTRANEVRPDGSVRVVKSPVACRIGQLDSYDLTPSTTPGTYTARDGDFTGQECAAHSFARTVTLTVSPDGTQLTVAGRPDTWLKVTATPREETDSFHLFHYNMPNGAWVVCGVLVKNKSDEVQLLLTNLGIAAPGLYELPPDKVGKQDAILRNQDIGGEVVEDVILPWTQARDAVSLAPPGTSKEAELDDDFRKNFQILCARRK